MGGMNVSSLSNIPSQEEQAVEFEHLGEIARAARLWAKVGRQRQRDKSFAEARRAYRHAVRLDGTQHGCLANLAQLEADAGESDVARDLIGRALALHPTNVTYG